MAYAKKCIKDILEDIRRGDIYLPAIQRKYVWKDSQITKLLDSIMLGYPIGTFLFWKVKKTIINVYGERYDFLRALLRNLKRKEYIYLQINTAV